MIKSSSVEQFIYNPGELLGQCPMSQYSMGLLCHFLALSFSISYPFCTQHVFSKCAKWLTEAGPQG